MNVNPFSYLIEKLKSKVSKTGDTMTGQLVVKTPDSDCQIELAYKHTSTTSQPSRINLGNSIPNGTAGSSFGRVRLYGNGTYRTDLQATTPTADRLIELPNASGTVALTSDFNFGAKQSITPSSYTSWGEYGHCYYRTRGKEVELNISLSGASGANGVTITTLPSACRPSHNKGFACVSVDGGGVAEGAIYVLADGKVNITSAKTYFIANIKYTAD